MVKQFILVAKLLKNERNAKGKFTFLFISVLSKFGEAKVTSSSFLCVFTLIYVKMFAFLQQIHYICTQNAYK